MLSLTNLSQFDKIYIISINHNRENTFATNLSCKKQQCVILSKIDVKQAFLVVQKAIFTKLKTFLVTDVANLHKRGVL